MSLWEDIKDEMEDSYDLSRLKFEQLAEKGLWANGAIIKEMDTTYIENCLKWISNRTYDHDSPYSCFVPVLMKELKNRRSRIELAVYQSLDALNRDIEDGKIHFEDIVGVSFDTNGNFVDVFIKRYYGNF